MLNSNFDDGLDKSFLKYPEPKDNEHKVSFLERCIARQIIRLTDDQLCDELQYWVSVERFDVALVVLKHLNERRCSDQGRIALRFPSGGYMAAIMSDPLGSYPADEFIKPASHAFDALKYSVGSCGLIINEPRLLNVGDLAKHLLKLMNETRGVVDQMESMMDRVKFTSVNPPTR